MRRRGAGASSARRWIGRKGTILSAHRCCRHIDPAFYRRRAEQARRLAETMNRRIVRGALLAAAKNYDEIVEDLERGHIRKRHAELMP